MTAIVRSEIRQARFTRSLWAVPVAGIVVASIGAVLMVTAGKDADIADQLSQLGPLRFGPTNFGLLLVVLGIRVFADETQHHTLAATLVRTPSRRAVIAAKASVAAAIALLFCVAVDVITIPVTVMGVSSRDLDMTYDIAETTAMLARVGLAMTLLAVLGVFLGAAFRNRTVALIATIVWFALGESLIGALFHLSRYLPGAAVRGVVTAEATPEHLGSSMSALILAAYVLAVGVAALYAARRDIP
jgi:ABC-2 type transport system permease protein